jgi:putative glutamine amidotransferase
MIKIGLTDTGTEWKHENYVRWLKGGGAEGVEVIRLSAALGNLNEAVGCDGLVISGGVDIHPSLYGGELEYKRSPAGGWEMERDLFEQAVLRSAWERGLPVLGVCRGLQLINVTLNGKLIQDLGIPGDGVHQGMAGVDKNHMIGIEPDSLLAAVVGRDSGEVNSAHHQAIDRLGDGLRVNCRAEDGTIEGIEWADAAGRPFLLAVQWHPERMLVNGMEDEFLYLAIRDRFVEEVKEARVAG